MLTGKAMLRKTISLRETPEKQKQTIGKIMRTGRESRLHHRHWVRELEQDTKEYQMSLDTIQNTGFMGYLV